ncbi:MAG: RNA 2',3'-cyclic phosphodiesterase [Gammaproteobacteria bacterium]|nr:RNA 2',3'-cyclic phosphodiesterase [Gammaproteobacteria bacterium]NNJ98288.1 RNA 2',3'-cyclic phosphodiesterase [Gammaproteobacteria bacterium]
MADTSKHKRLFLALWPDDFTRQRLANVQNAFRKTARLKSARPVPSGNLHITIHFLGEVSTEVCTRLQTALADAKAQSCTLVVDHWGYFPRPRVVWLGGIAPEPLIDLVAQTQSCIQACIAGYHQKRFVPHITIFRKARHPLEIDDFDPIRWRIDRFALVESVTHPHGAEYNVLNQWMLD